jgi:hypothetical protein
MRLSVWGFPKEIKKSFFASKFFERMSSEFV